MELSKEKKFKFRLRRERELEQQQQEPPTQQGASGEWGSSQGASASWGDPEQEWETNQRKGADWGTKAMSEVKETAAGVADYPLAAVRMAGEASDEAFGTDIAQYPEAAQEYVDEGVREARTKAGKDPDETSGYREAAKFAMSLTPLGRLMRIKGVITGVTAAAGYAGTLGALNYKPAEGENYDFGQVAERFGEDALIGGAFGVAAPLIGAGVKAGSSVYQGGKRIITGASNPGMTLNKAAGKDKQQIIDELRTTESKVPGTKLTPAEATTAARSPEFAALEKSVINKRDPKDFVVLAEKQEEAARDVLKGIKETGGGKEAAIKARKKAAEPHYAAAANDTRTIVNTTPIVRELKALIAVNSKNKEVAEPLRQILKEVKSSKNRLGRETNLTVQKMKSMSEGIRSKIKEKVDGVPKYDQVTLMKVKKLLDKQIEAKSPSYKKARMIFKEKSVAVNQAELGDDLLKAYNSPLEGGKSRKAVFANVVDKYKTTLNPKTKKPRLSSLDKKQEEGLAGVMDLLSRQVKAAELAKAGTASVKTRIQPFQVPSTGIFSPILSFARGTFNRAVGGASEKGLQRLGKIMAEADNKTIADLMENASPVQIEEMAAFLRTSLKPILQSYGAAVGVSAKELALNTPEDK